MHFFSFYFSVNDLPCTFLQLQVFENLTCMITFLVIVIIIIIILITMFILSSSEPWLGPPLESAYSAHALIKTANV